MGFLKKRSARREYVLCGVCEKRAQRAVCARWNNLTGQNCSFPMCHTCARRHAGFNWCPEHIQEIETRNEQPQA